MPIRKKDFLDLPAAASAVGKPALLHFDGIAIADWSGSAPNSTIRPNRIVSPTSLARVGNVKSPNATARPGPINHIDRIAHCQMLKTTTSANQKHKK
jgi:hypothetical protein